MTDLISAGSRGYITYEGASTWPTYTKVFNTMAFKDPRPNPQKSEGIDQRAKGYPGRGGITFQSRGLPQLTWFEGTYKVPAHVGTGPGLCMYPSLVGPYKDKKQMCLAPGTKLSPADEALLRKQMDASDKSYASVISEQGDLPEYTGPRVSGLGDAGTTYEKALSDKLNASYRTTEYALIGAFLAGAFLIWRQG
jgi:hypothetical protein